MTLTLKRIFFMFDLIEFFYLNEFLSILDYPMVSVTLSCSKATEIMFPHLFAIKWWDQMP